MPTGKEYGIASFKRIAHNIQKLLEDFDEIVQYECFNSAPIVAAVKPLKETKPCWNV